MITEYQNPFEEESVANEWIQIVEAEKGLTRDKDIYPLLASWVQKIQPHTIVEIGSGQGICAEQVKSEDNTYIGIEPSKYLVNRARSLYDRGGLEFMEGNAYNLPLADNYADAVFSVMVWFHLEDITKASDELARILKPGGSFLIITANPNSDQVWEHFFKDPEKEGKKLIGRIATLNGELSKSVIYQHTLKEMTEALETRGLVVDSTEGFGAKEEFKDDGLFVSIMGHKR